MDARQAQIQNNAVVLTRLAVENLRCFDRAVLEPGRGVNLISGRNGAGKTSLLEGVFLLSNGKSFRKSARATLIRDGASILGVKGEFADSHGRHTVKVTHSPAGKRIEWDGEIVSSVSILARRMPTLLLANDLVERYRASARGRQAVMDWGLFHVEPDFHAAWLKYRYLLRQRNELLRQGGGPAIQQWTDELAGAGETVTAYRSEFAQGVEASLGKLLQKFGVADDIRFRFYRGWRDGITLMEALSAAIARDRAAGHTTIGPHRSEPRLFSSSRPLLTAGSTGQVKLIVYLLAIAVSRLVVEQRSVRPLLLIDDLSAGFDQAATEALLHWVSRSGSQTFVTDVTTHQAQILNGATEFRTFHVEQGAVSHRRALHG